MKLQNKQTGKYLDISPEMWEKLKKQWSTRYRVVKDEVVVQRIPVQMNEPTREEMIDSLKEKGIRVPSNIKDETLKLKYERNN